MVGLPPVIILAITLTMFHAATARAVTRTDRRVVSVDVAAHSGAAASGRYLVGMRGVRVYFENPRSSVGYSADEVIRRLGERAVRADVVRQLARIRKLGFNTISYELRTADPTHTRGPFLPTQCEERPVRGLRWPEPTAIELANLARFLDLLHHYRLRLVLNLVNTHQDDWPPANAERWLRAILRVVKRKPALQLVSFDGESHLNDDGIPDACGTPATPLWLGPTSRGGRYASWALDYARSLGIPARKVTVQAIVGNPLMDGHAPTPADATDNHFWSPVETLKSIYDALGFPPDQRTYALKLYEQPKCQGIPVSFHCHGGQDPHEWADESLRRVRSVVGDTVRIVATEFGAGPPVDTAYPTPIILDSLGFLFAKYGVDGGTYWQWVSRSLEEWWIPMTPDAVVKRGSHLALTRVGAELVDLYGFHLARIRNGSFEHGLNGWNWTGKGFINLLALNLLDSPTPWHGQTFLSLVGSISSAPIPASPRVRYTTGLRVRGFGKAVIRSLSCRKRPLASKAFGVVGQSQFFTTALLRYVTPPRTCFVQLTISGNVEVDDVH